MGGRSATSGVATFGRKTGTRLLPKQYKQAVSDSAEFIFLELKQNPATQNIIRRSFRGNVAQITFDLGAGEVVSGSAFVEQLNKITNDLQSRALAEARAKKEVNTWSAYDVARAKMEAIKQALQEIEKLKKKKTK